MVLDSEGIRNPENYVFVGFGFWKNSNTLKPSGVPSLYQGLQRSAVPQQTWPERTLLKLPAIMQVGSNTPDLPHWEATTTVPPTAESQGWLKFLIPLVKIMTITSITIITMTAPIIKFKVISAFLFDILITSILGIGISSFTRYIKISLFRREIRYVKEM
jgi:hypothetical protein